MCPQHHKLSWWGPRPRDRNAAFHQSCLRFAGDRTHRSRSASKESLNTLRRIFGMLNIFTGTWRHNTSRILRILELRTQNTQNTHITGTTSTA